MKRMRMAITLFVLAAVGAALAAGMSDSAVKAMLDKASGLYDKKEYAKAVELYDQLSDYIKGDSDQNELYNIACTYSLVGRKERALEVLRQAVASGWSDTAHMSRDTDLDNIRSEPAYRAILEDIPAREAEREAREKRIQEEFDAAHMPWRNPGEKKRLGGRDFELVGVLTETVRGGSRTIGSFCPFKGRIYVAYSMPLMSDTGFVVASLNPADATWRWDFRIVDAARRRFRPIGDNLYVAGTTLDLDYHRPGPYAQSPAPQISNVYRLFGDGSYIRYHNVPHATAVYDIAALDGQLFAQAVVSTGESLGPHHSILRSTDDCVSWTTAYEFSPRPGQGLFVTCIAAFRSRLYAFRNAWRPTDGKFVPNAFEGKEAVVYDGASWSETDLIADKELISVAGARGFKDQLVLLGQYFKPGDDSVTLVDMRSALYAWNGEGRASRTFQASGFDFQSWFSDDDAFYVLTKGGQVYVSKDLKGFSLLLTLPKEVGATAVGAYGGQLYIGTKTGEVYRTKL